MSMASGLRSPKQNQNDATPLSFSTYRHVQAHDRKSRENIQKATLKKKKNYSCQTDKGVRHDITEARQPICTPVMDS